ncbi:MAG: FAD-dependent oxidoreductase [Deltaproteobacteria bacterium]|jgi:ferredoxin/flavodoxin---NADP+ reductase|nr:FAD-dependent oxidoreductase [Deltaproteobacteria bacterium]MBT6492594.1 FAD-dependent oxidoreductase [Deltaproteobacteria bacterium]
MSQQEDIASRFSGGLRVAIIGAGPAGFYAAAAWFKQKDINVHVDMFERLPSPFGLVRYGVAPDHARIKSVTRVYDKIASNEKFRYFGNVQYGTDLTLEDLSSHYDQIVFSVGTQGDRMLNVPGEELEGSVSAREFVAWYNGHPDYRDWKVDLSHKAVVVVGVGNVALDVARILAKTPDELRPTDIACHALDQLRESKVEDIYIIARRGPAQVKFTLHEIKEFGDFEAATTSVRTEDLELDPGSASELERNKAAQRNFEVLEKFSKVQHAANGKRVHFLFKTSPVEISGEGRVEGMRVVANRLEEQEGGYVQSIATDTFNDIPCGLVLRSVGYRGTPLAGLPFDEDRGVVANVNGRVVDKPCGTPIPGLYVAGWIKRGPSGVIGTNKPDAQETVKLMLEDAVRAAPCSNRGPEAVVELLKNRNVDFVDFARWERINQHELREGQEQGRSRIKLATSEEMLKI